jgi:hypothetical protein
MMKKLRTMALAGLLVAVPLAAHAQGSGDRAEYEATVAEVFTQADANGDGVLSETEFASFHELMRARMEAKHFARIDADGSGGITLEELEAAGPPHGGHPGPPM